MSTLNERELKNISVMYEGDKRRDATSKIRGFLFQDYVMIKCLLNSDVKCVCSEYLEDVDVIYENNTFEFIQVKYYPKTGPNAEKMDHIVAAIVAMVGLLAVGYKILVYVMQMYGSNNLEITFLPDRKRREYQVANWIMLFIAIWIASTAIGYLKYNGEFQKVIEIIWVAAFGIMVITLLICIVHRGWGKIKTLFNKSVEKNTSKFPSIWEQAFLSAFLVWGITTSGVPVYDGKILLVFKWSTVWSFIIMEVIIICVAFNKKTLHAKMSFYSEKYQKNLYVYTITDKGIYICGDSARMEKRTECYVIKEEDILDKQIKLPPWEEK